MDGSAPNKVNPANQFAKVIVKFVRRETKEQFYHGLKHLKKNKSTKDIGLSQFSDNGIFVSESLTSKNKLLFKDCLKFKKENNYKYIVAKWTKKIVHVELIFIYLQMIRIYFLFFFLLFPHKNLECLEVNLNI